MHSDVEALLAFYKILNDGGLIDFGVIVFSRLAFVDWPFSEDAMLFEGPTQAWQAKLLPQRLQTAAQAVCGLFHRALRGRFLGVL